MTDTANLEHDPTGWMPTAIEMQAEQAVLGAMLYPTTLRGGAVVSSPAIDVVTGVIRPDDLFRDSHRRIMAAVLAVDASGGTVDAISVAGELEHRGDLGRVGGAPYLHTLLADLPTSANAGYYAELVLEAAMRRAALEFARKVQTLPHAELDRNELAAAVDEAHTAYLERREQSEKAVLLPAGLEQELDEIEAGWGCEQPGAFTTGIHDLDAVLNVGLGSLVVLAAMQGQGKSTLAQTIARHYAIPCGEPTIYFTMEMPRAQLQRRDLAALAGLRVDTATGKTPMHPGDWARLEQAKQKYASAPAYYIDDTPHVSISHIRAQLRHLHRKHGHVGVAIVDLLTLMEMPKRDRPDIEIGEVTRALKLMALEFQTIVLVVAQLNRNPAGRTDGRPRVNDLRGSANIEQDADAVLMLHDAGKDDESRLGELDIIVGKQRDGITGPVIAVADMRHQARIADLRTND